MLSKSDILLQFIYFYNTFIFLIAFFMKVSLIVAMDLEKGIGKNNDLMWHLPADMLFFKETTLNHIVVMGRKNFESIPERFRPLPNRENAILTRNTAFEAPNCTVFHSMEGCLKPYENEDKRTVFIIGGGQIYEEALEKNRVDEMFITFVDHTFGADTFFPSIDFSLWNEEVLRVHEADSKNAYNFTVKKFTKKLS
ncbi:TPA: trimethoprim-resistant dihydrofolate reductase DfrA36 [Escherichia coli]|nr:trimethoprim-resistant dihydrofolate reductase DfrA36 [Escherichia coli]